jgi:hypothetical protein
MTEENTDYDTITSLSMTQIRKLKVGAWLEGGMVAVSCCVT